MVKEGARLLLLFLEGNKEGVVDAVMRDVGCGIFLRWGGIVWFC